MPRLKAVLLSLATLCAPAARAQIANPAVPGTVNYVEGLASIGGRGLNQNRWATPSSRRGRSCKQLTGRAELLLTPGCFSAWAKIAPERMVSPNRLNTQIELDRGRADIEVDEIDPRNDIQVAAGAASTRLLKDGLYAFDADREPSGVFKGEAGLGEKRAVARSTQGEGRPPGRSDG